MRINKFFKSFLVPMLVVVLCAFVLSGCQSKKVVLTTGFTKDEVFKIADISCTLPEMLVYLTDVQNQYEGVYGEGVWEAELNGVTLEDNIKDTVLARLSQVKALYLMSISKGVTLDDNEISNVSRCATEYFNKLTDEQVEYLGITQEKLVGIYTEYALSEKVVQFLIEDINPEISDDEARSVEVLCMYFPTGVTDGAGNFVSYEQSDKSRIFDLAYAAKQRLDAGESFDIVAAEYVSTDSINKTFSRGVMAPEIEAAVFDLSKGEISQIIQTEAGYYIFKCISPLDREKTDANKLKLVDERRQQTIEDEYETFVDGLLKNLNHELWDELTLDKSMKIDAGFFATYENVFNSQDE